MPGTDVFLSYARTDQPVARKFAERLVAEGFGVWWDGSLRSGETFDEVIEQKLRDAKAVVVLWSPRSVTSRWVRAEATQADRRNKLAPAIIEPCDRPIIFELTHAAELSGWAGDGGDPRWRMFVNDVRRLVEQESDQESERGDYLQGTSAMAVPAPPKAACRQPLRPGADEVIRGNGQKRDTVVRELQRDGIATPADPHVEVHCLELDDEALGKGVFVIASSGVKIGRSAPADLVLSHKSISREHCMIGLANDELIVTDLNSTNGTYIDDMRVSRATILPVGSIVRFGHISLRHGLRSAAEADRLELGHDANRSPLRRLAAAP